MHIRTFRAANLNDALAMIRDQMGPEASVLHTRQLPPARLNPFARTRIEVTAGLKPLRCSEPSLAAKVGPPASDAAEEQAADAPPTADHSPADGSAMEPSPSHPATIAGPFPDKLAGPLLDRSLGWLPGGRPAGLANRVDASDDRLGDAWGDRLNSALIEELIDAGLPRRLATVWAESAAHASAAPLVQRRSPRLSETFAASVADGIAGAGGLTMETAREALARWLERSLRIGNSIEGGRGGRRVVALVGPTGVGKTTTIAKLAASFQLQQNVRVGLLTLDTFRAAAIEQLDAFARALGVPLAVVRSAGEVAGAMERLGDVDLVFVDTVGQSPRGEEKIAAMGRLLAAVRPDETHLVVDANGSFGSATDVCMAFKPLQPTAAIISKLDEVWRPAPVIAAVLEGALQISYVTTGQRVPEDIAAAGRETLAAAASGLAAAGCGA